MSQIAKCPQCESDLPSDAPAGLCPACLLQQGAGDPTRLSEISFSSESHQTQFRAPSPEELGELFPQFEILQLLGQGGMGAVYKARQIKLDRIVALKIIAPELGRDPVFAARFLREARALARLNHPCIVSVHDFGEIGDVYFIVMEYVEGVNLRQMMEHGKLKPEEALAIVPQICEALDYAHEHGVVHRDIKPENLLIDTKGHLKIADFGLARLTAMDQEEFTLTRANQVMGTPRYMAPEQMEQTSMVDHRVDIYSLGVVFYEMLTGELPMGRFDPPSRKVEIDVRLDEVVMRTLEKEPGRRYQHASDVKSDVEVISYRENSPSPLRATPPLKAQQEKIRAWFQPHSIRLGLIAVLNLIAGILVFIVYAEEYLDHVDRVMPDLQIVLVGGSVVLGCTVLLINYWIMIASYCAATLQGRGEIRRGTFCAMLTPPGLLLGIVGGFALLRLLDREDVRRLLKPLDMAWGWRSLSRAFAFSVVLAVIAMAIHGLVTPVERFAPYRYSVDDTAILVPASKAFPAILVVAEGFGESGPGENRAQIEGRPRNTVQITLYTDKQQVPARAPSQGRGVSTIRTSGRSILRRDNEKTLIGWLSVSLGSLRYRYTVEDTADNRVHQRLLTREGDELTTDILLQWMKETGIDTKTKGLDQELQQLITILSKAADNRIKDLVKGTAFTVKSFGGSVEYRSPDIVEAGVAILWLCLLLIGIDWAILRIWRSESSPHIATY